MPHKIAARIARVLALFAVTLSISLALPPIAATVAHARDDIGASRLIAALGEDTIAILKETQPASPDRYGRLHDLVSAAFDMPHIAAFVAGRFWHAASAAERDRFTAAFGNYVTGLYAARFSRYAGQSFAIAGQRTEADGTATVSSKVIEPNATPGERVDWRVAGAAGGYRITDVSVSGVSIARTKREEFGSILARNGGRIGALAAALEAKSGNRPQSAGSGD